ncbi:hypothetical protein K431DRAFT_232320 [Polychaeton citri CBS 116435]|uniref:Zn(2)-C6 fungal-type domain-containing protein n=1 Tax=Polychaeton citri CBS 116435 TaxID=1314669 RepID=A0A9P4Q1R7_9PEZI|nr:hypothetical protein K431DRAFT_232320 [Polychaeton citri CBS 116435]
MRACTNCVRAKAKCAPSANGSRKCDRCYRMDKTCQPSPPIRKRRVTIQPNLNRPDTIEEKLDNLFNAIRAATKGNQASSEVVMRSLGLEELLSPNGSHPSSSSPVESPYAQNSHSSHGTFRAISTPSTSLPAASPAAATPHANALYDIGSSDAEYYLRRFKDEFLPNLPFLILSSSVSTHILQQDQPFLWSAIMTVASVRSTQQIALSKQFRVMLGQELYVNGTKSLDLLLAILVYAIWDRRYCLDKSIITSLAQSAKAIVYDLDLDKPPSTDASLQLLNELKGACKPTRRPYPPSFEETRALMGCFLLSSISSFARHGEALRWTNYCEECLRRLEEQKPEPTDALLAQIVRSRLLSEKIHSLPWSSLARESSTPGVPAAFYLSSLISELNRLRRSTPPELLQNKILLSEFYCTEWSIYESGLSKASGLVGHCSNQRLECLYSCLQAVKAWVDVFLTITPAQRFGASVCTYARMLRALVCIIRLYNCDFPEWNSSMVRETLNLSSILDETAKSFAQVKAAAGLDPEPSLDSDFYTTMSLRTRSMQTMWENMVVSPDAHVDPLLWPDLLDFPLELADMVTF